MTYSPKPIDTSKVELSTEILRLCERLAINNHELWAELRIAEGWNYGPERDDTAKTHPDLVPYEELPESEKEYDRTMVVRTLKALQALGYDTKAGERHALLGGRYRAPEWLERRGEFCSHPEVLLLLERWEHCDGWTPQRLTQFYTALVEALLGVGENLLAYDAASQGLQSVGKDDLRLRQLLGLALARSGATTEASSVFDALYSEGFRDEETLGMRASVRKDRWLRCVGTNDESTMLQDALRIYGETFEQTKGYWPGINAATLAVLNGAMPRAERYVVELLPSCVAEVERLGEDSPESYWALATLGEAALVKDDLAQAGQWYVKAMKVSGNRHGDVASTREQARMLLRHKGLEENLVGEWFPTYQVVTFAGHMIDRPERNDRRFPRALAPRVKETLKGHLRAKGENLVVFSSAACGADILFLEAVLELGGQAYWPGVRRPSVRKGGVRSGQR
jgi:hypothetical protein